MKKLLAILVVVLLVVCCCTLFACNNSNDDVEPQVIDVDTPDVDQSLNTVSGSYAWEKIKQAALNNSPSTGGYLNFNHILGLDFKKNGDGNKYTLQIAGSVDQGDTSNSRLLLKIDKTTAANVTSQVVAIYYIDGVCYADLTGIKKGAEIVYTENIDLGYVVDRVVHMFEGTSIADIFYNQLMGLDIGSLIGFNIGDLGSLLTGMLLPETVDIKDLGNVIEQIDIPFQLADLIGIVLGVVGSFLNDDIQNIIYQILGLDLAKLDAVVTSEVAIVLSAKIENNVLSSLGISMDFPLDSAKTDTYDDFGYFTEDLEISLGAYKLTKGTDPNLLFKDEAERDGISEYVLLPDTLKSVAREYSVFDFDIAISAGIHLSEKKITVTQIDSALGNLLSKLLSSTIPTNSSIWNTLIDINGDHDYSVNIEVKGSICVMDNTKTNLSITIKDKGSEDVRAAIYYVGAYNSIYVDLSGMIGSIGRYKITDVDLIGIIDDALSGLGMAAGQALSQAEIETYEQLIEMLENGTIPYRVTKATSQSGTVTSTMDLIINIFNHIELIKEDPPYDNIFNIKSLIITVVNDACDYISELIFPAKKKDDNGVEIDNPNYGAKLPITEIVLNYYNSGVGEEKLVGLTVTLGDNQGIFNGAAINLGVNAKFGTTTCQAKQQVD